jgi:hypothetical protein
VRTRTLLLYAPTADGRWLPFPPLGIAVLAGHLRRRGLEVELDDLEIRFLDQDRCDGWPAAPIVRRLAARHNNPLSPFGRRRLVQRHLEGAAGRGRRDVVDQLLDRCEALLDRELGRFTHLGLSVMSRHQLDTSLCLARRLKQRHGLKVILGGSFVTPAVAGLLERYPFVDYMIVGEGELPLERLLRGDAPEGIDNVIYRDRRGRAAASPVVQRYAEEMQPDFSGLPMDLYRRRGPPLVLPVEMSKGCRNRCAFCVTRRKPLLLKEPGVVVRELAEARARHGARCFLFVDNAFNLDREHSVAVCRAMIEARLEIRWSAYFIPELQDRAYFRLLRQAGCVQLRWGIEAPARGLLSRMNKSYDPDGVALALRRAAACGIWNHLLFMVGYPGERPADLLSTARYILQNRRAFRSALVCGLDIERVALAGNGGQQALARVHPGAVLEREVHGLPVYSLRWASRGPARRLLQLLLAGCGVGYRRNFSRYRDRIHRDQFIYEAFRRAPPGLQQAAPP